MKHKPFEEWIFSDEEISPANQKALYDHLRDCDDCYIVEKNWRRVERLITDTPVVGPAAGFSGRWQSRLEFDQRRASKRQSLAILAVTSTGAGIFLLLYGVQLLSSLQIALVPFFLWVARIGRTLSLFEAFAAELMRSAGFFQPVLPVFLMMGVFAVIGAAAILWLKMFRTLARVQGLTQWA